MKIFWGKVIKGAQRGKDLGFPTANIAIHTAIEEGIYLAKVTIHENVKNRHPEQSEGSQSTKKDSSPSVQNDKEYNALTFIGKAITFGATKVQAESHMLGFSGDVYGKYITVQLLKKIRDNKKFATKEELIKQMNDDLLVAKKFFTPWC